MAEEICRELGIELGKMNITHFADGGLKCRLKSLSVAARCISFS